VAQKLLTERATGVALAVDMSMQLLPCEGVSQAKEGVWSLPLRH
jgi:hypothetical protein